jgi:hypothetical protein
MHPVTNHRQKHIREEIIIIFFHELGRLTRSGIDALPSFPGASTISSPSRFVVEGMFWKSGVIHSFEMVDPVLFVFGSHVLYSRDNKGKSSHMRDSTSYDNFKVKLIGR